MSQSKSKNSVLAVFAHPDDEAFGPAGTIAKLAKHNNVHLICATRGEAGMGASSNLAKTREEELKSSARILGVKSVSFLGFIDGTLSNSIYHKLAAKIENIAKKLEPGIIITHEQKGISGHIDHITVSMVTTFVFYKLSSARKLMYYCIDQKAASYMKDYFIYFPPGYRRDQVDEIVNIQNVWDQKIKAMMAHKSQEKDAMKILERIKTLPKEEYFLIAKK